MHKNSELCFQLSEMSVLPQIESEWNRPEAGILEFKIYSAKVMKRENSNCYFSTPNLQKNSVTCVDVLKNNTQGSKFTFKRTKLLIVSTK